jgi:hypothetical protein
MPCQSRHARPHHTSISRLGCQELVALHEIAIVVVANMIPSQPRIAIVHATNPRVQ